MTLADYLKQHNLTLEAFGARFDPPVRPSNVARWRDGIILPRATNVALIEEVTDGDVTYADMWATWIAAQKVNGA